MPEQVILVNQNNNQIGIEEKIKAHQEAKLHRAFSVYVFNSSGKLLLQQRAKSKYHCGGLWSNTCCGHPRPDEKVLAAAHRRLKEEMGFDCNLKEIFQIIYRAPFSNGLTEHEYLHVFIGQSDQLPQLNPAEAENWRHANLNSLKADIQKNPSQYTEWLKLCIAKVAEHLA